MGRIELKPCPFCGGKAKLSKACKVYCKDCFANIHGGEFGDAGEIKSASEWNRRVIEEPKTVYGFYIKDLLVLADAMRKMGVRPEDARAFSQNAEMCLRYIEKVYEDSIKKEIQRLSGDW